MNPTPLTVLATFKAQPGKEGTLRQELFAMIPITRKEPGCINFDLHRAAEDPARFMFYENWTSRALLDDHIKRPHVQALLAKAPGLLAEPPQITMWEKVG